MKYRLLTVCFFLLFFSNNLFAQKILVLDGVSNTPVQDAYAILNDSIVLATDDFGFFTIKKNIKISKVKISHLNYKDKELAYKNIKDTLYMVEKANSLEEVVIKGIKNKKRIITYVHPLSTVFNTFGEIRPLPDCYHAVYIPPKRLNDSLIIKNIVFKRSLKKNKTWAPFNVLLMTADSITNLPSAVIYKDSVLPSNKTLSKTLKIPVLNNLKVPKNGLYVVVEIFSKDYYGKNDFYKKAIPYFKAVRLKKNSEFRQFRMSKKEIRPVWVEPLYSKDRIQSFNFGVELTDY